MSTLKSTIDSLASQFAVSIISALRSASIQEVMEVAGGTARVAASPAAPAFPAAGAPVKRGPGRPKKVAAFAAAPAVEAPAKKKAGRPGRLGRRSVADIGALVESVVSLLQQNPDGLRAEQIRGALGIEAKELPRPLSDGLAAGTITKTGQKRATTYFAAGGGGRGKKRR